MNENRRNRWINPARIAIPPRGDGSFESAVLERDIWKRPSAPERKPVSGEPSDAYLMRMKTGENVFLRSTSFSIGSGDNADYRIIDNENIDRVHAQINVINGEYFITDMGSEGGTQLDGVPVASTTKLEHNKVIRMADEDFIFKNK